MNTEFFFPACADKCTTDSLDYYHPKLVTQTFVINEEKNIIPFRRQIVTDIFPSVLTLVVVAIIIITTLHEYLSKGQFKNDKHKSAIYILFFM